jgi:hypothetical protein
MWELLAKIFNNPKATALSRGAMLTFAVMGIVFLPLSWWVGQAAYDEFQSTRSDVKTILTSINGLNTKIEVSNADAAARDRRITDIEAINQVQGGYIARFAEHIARLEGQINQGERR